MRDVTQRDLETRFSDAEFVAKVEDMTAALEREYATSLGDNRGLVTLSMAYALLAMEPESSDAGTSAPPPA
jgi:hypothetical protein